MMCFHADLQLYHSETLEVMLQRWSKLERDFRMKNGRYDISKIPDIYDCIKYDTQHNASLGLEETLELFRLSRALADIIIPQVDLIKTLKFLTFDTNPFHKINGSCETNCCPFENERKNIDSCGRI